MLVKAPIAASSRMSGAERRLSVAMEKFYGAYLGIFSPLRLVFDVSVSTALHGVRTCWRCVISRGVLHPQGGSPLL